MSLEQTFRRLALQPSSVCLQCRRTLATSARRQQQQPQSATQAFTEIFQSGRSRDAAGTQRSTRARSPTTQAASPSPARNSSATYDLARQTVREAMAPAQREQRDAALRDLERGYQRKEYEQQMPRRWKDGDVYAPHDLSGVEAAKWKKIRRKPKAKYGDVMDQLGMNPMHHYKNFSIMSEYMTEMGRIRHSNDTGLRPVNQRKMAKAIRRAIGVGLMPSVHRHPEILRGELEARSRR